MKCEKMEWLDLDSGSAETNTDSGIWLKSSKGSGVKIGSGPKKEIETQVHIHFPTTECDFLRLVIQVQEWQVWELKLTLKCCSNWVAK